MTEHKLLSPCPFCGEKLFLDIDEGGGVANKSSLEDWLTANYGVDRYTGHVIGNRLEQIFNPAQWKEGRAEPKLSDYPDLEQRFGQAAAAQEEAARVSETLARGRS